MSDSETTFSETGAAEPMGTTASRSDHRKVFRSAIDTWLAVVLGFPIAAAFALGVYLFATGRPGDASMMLLTGAGILGVTTVFTVPCRYTLLADTLSIRCGLICYHIPYDTIDHMEISSTLRSGPAMSLRRVVIRTNRREYIVSPVDRELFIEQVKERMPSK